MGQGLHRAGVDELEEQFLLTENEEQGKGSDFSISLPVLPSRTPEVFGLSECQAFLQNQLIQPLRYKRALIVNPPVSSNSKTSLGFTDFPSLRILSLVGRPSVGKRLLIKSVCEKNAIYMKTLSTPADLVAFDLEKTITDFDDTYNPPIVEPEPVSRSWPWSSARFYLKDQLPSTPKVPESWVLVIESGVIADNSGSKSGHDRSFLVSRLHTILTNYLALSQTSSLIKIIFLLHEPFAINNMNLASFLSGKSSMYARVLPYEARVKLILNSLRQFYDHDLMKRMNNLVGFSNKAVMEALYNASAWYTPGEILNFLDRSYNNVLVELVNYLDMTTIPSTVPAIDLSKVLMDELELTQNAVLNNSSLNQIPIHEIYGPRPYALDLQKIQERSTPFEHLFELTMIDIENTQWLTKLNPFSGKQSKRKLEADIIPTTPKVDAMNPYGCNHPLVCNNPKGCPPSSITEQLDNTVFVLPNKRTRLEPKED